MNIHVIDFYQNRHNQEVIAVHEHPEVEFESWITKAPQLPRGWWELACLPVIDRLEFIMAFWKMRFPYTPYAEQVIRQFCLRLEDIGIYLVKKREETYFFPHLVYSMSDPDDFYYGFPPATKEDLQQAYHALQRRLPEEYILFMKIHNGFGRREEEGILPMGKIPHEMHRMHAELVSGLHPMIFNGEPLDPMCLIPFYKKEEGHIYQCFHKEWYPDKGMGTLGLEMSSGRERHICKNTVFPSFLRWLMFYVGAEDV